MISASAAGAHRFGRVKRNGYDPNEVDATVARLVEALEKHESKIEALEAKLGDADASADAIRRTLLVAESTKDEILGEAAAEATRIRESAEARAEGILVDARHEAETILTSARDEAEAMSLRASQKAEEMAKLAEQLEEEIASRRDAILVEAYDEAERISVDAELQASERIVTATAEGEALLEDAHERATSMAHEAARVSEAASIEAARIRTEALQEAERVTAEAEEAAEAIRRSAEEDAIETQQKTLRLRDAVAALDAAARNLASATTTGAPVVDLSAIEAAETIGHEAPGGAREPGAEIREPLLSVAEATAELAREDEHEADGDPPAEAAPTYYQRSTGTPLSERVKIAKRSG